MMWLLLVLLLLLGLLCVCSWSATEKRNYNAFNVAAVVSNKTSVAPIRQTVSQVLPQAQLSQCSTEMQLCHVSQVYAVCACVCVCTCMCVCVRALLPVLNRQMMNKESSRQEARREANTKNSCFHFRFCCFYGRPWAKNATQCKLNDNIHNMLIIYNLLII